MTFTMSFDFAMKRSAYAEAYKAFDALADAGADGSPEYEAASAAEIAAFNDAMNFPAVNAADVSGKLAMMADAGSNVAEWNDYPKYMAAIQADMLNLQRPCVSPAIADAFATWAAAWLALSDGEDDTQQADIDAETAASKALFELPCVAPGDYMAKDYIDRLGEDGGYPGGFPFLIKNWQENGESAALKDFRAVDLGRCMLALGRTDFDAAAWIAGMEEVGGSFYVMVDGDKRGFWQAADVADDAPDCQHIRHRILQELLCGPFGQDRMRAVVALIMTGHPEHIMDAGQREIAA